MPFIVFEGGEGSGKSTQSALLAGFLRSKGLTVLETREPGGTPLAEDIRKVFKSVPTSGDVPTPRTELLLVMAARSQHIDKTIKPALARHEWIICDRFIDSSYIYQGFRGGLEKTEIDTVAAPILGNLQPDLTFVLRVQPETAHGRVASRPGTEFDRLDNELLKDASLHAAFEALVKSSTPYPDGRVPQRVLVDGQGTPEQVHRRIVESLRAAFGTQLK
ncbi:MAG: dTMP kinase [Betaproteobacteria bacterium]|nr:dTMP kinase [Betaproteobacteria bacterium]